MTPRVLTELTSTDPAFGLDSVEAERRLEDGLGNVVERRDPRPLTAIIRANVLTRFNLLLGILGAAIIATGAVRDALFVLVAVANTVIGVAQEWKARQTLHRLELVEAPTARAVRGGDEVDLPVDQVVLGDVLVAGRGDQIVADGKVLISNGAEIDESLLTGESDHLVKVAGDPVLSGSAVVAGSTRFVVTAVGDAGFANGLVARAREFQPATSEIRAGVDRILRYITWLIIPTAALLAWSQLISNATIGGAVTGTVAGVVSMIPEGLVLLATVSMAVGVIRLGRRDILTRELAAIEGLARVDTLCIDKTGTLTGEGLALDRVEMIGGAEASTAFDALGALARLDTDGNATSTAISAAFDNPGWVANQIVTFSSRRKWSGGSFDTQGAWVLGAPDVLIADDEHRATASSLAATGARTVVIGRASRIDDEAVEGFEPVAFVLLDEPIKHDAAATMRFLRDQGVDIKVISGDHPSTVTTVAAAVGLDTERVIDARSYASEAEFLDAAREAHVIGRISPDQKAAVVADLQANGRTVAMTGDGVNDLLALKQSDVGVAMGSGSPASRSVAQFVLLADEFGAMPKAVGEGRRVIGNVERVAKLFLVKSVYAFLLAIAVGIAQLPFPLLPRHLSLVASLTIGIPGFFLALEPNDQRARSGFVSRTLDFAIPTGLVAAAATFLAYADLGSDGATIDQSRTAAMIVLFVVGMWALAAVARPVTVRRGALLGAMNLGFVAALALPAGRKFFALDLPPIAHLPVLAPVVVGAVVAAELLHRRSALYTHARAVLKRPGPTP